MKKTMPDYIMALSDNSYEVLEEIIENKYKKFLELYWLLKEFSDNISEMKYKDTKHDKLKIELKISKLDVDEVISKLQDNITEEESILIWTEKKKIHIEITKDESELPE